MAKKTIKRFSDRDWLNPRLDQIFKAIFTRNSKESRAALKSFLEAATLRKIDSVSLTANNTPADYDHQRDVEYDINVIFSDGQYAEIEMEGFRRKYDYRNRAVYHANRLMTTYMEKGDDWIKVPTVYQISVLNFNLDNTEEPVNYYRLRTENNRILSENFNIITIELTKLRDYNIEELQKLPDIYKWGLFLRDADKKDRRSFISELSTMEEGIMQAADVLDFISQNRELWLMQQKAIDHEIEVKANIRIATQEARENGLAKGLQEGLEKGLQEGLAKGQKKGLQEGLAKGREEGRSEGRAEGLAEGTEQASIQAALNSLKLGIAPETVVQITNLPLEKILELKAHLSK